LSGKRQHPFEEEEPGVCEEIPISDESTVIFNYEEEDYGVLFDEECEPQVLTPSDETRDLNEVHSTVVIYTGITGKIAVPQHIHYSHRGPALQDYSHYEFASIVDVVPKKKSITLPIINLSHEDSVEENLLYQEVNFKLPIIKREYFTLLFVIYLHFTPHDDF
jgi:hypothetical protein